MNCRECTEVVTELARGGMVDAPAGEAAELHARECSACAARLSAEARLSNLLREYAANCAGLQAPAALKSTLLAAYANRQQDEGTISRRRRVPARAWAGVAAALVLVAIGVGGREWAVSPLESRAVHPGLGAEQAWPAAAVSAEPLAPRAVSPRAVAQPPDVTAVAQARAPRALRAPVPVAGMDDFDALPAVDRPVHNSDDVREMATEFIPLFACADERCLERSNLYRVKLPASAMQYFGVAAPQPERAHQLVNADVLVSEDGVARAVRFVR
jgi:hypothetical protein